jgi:hypothetical protein
MTQQKFEAIRALVYQINKALTLLDELLEEMKPPHKHSFGRTDGYGDSYCQICGAQEPKAVDVDRLQKICIERGDALIKANDRIKELERQKDAKNND